MESFLSKRNLRNNKCGGLFNKKSKFFTNKPRGKSGSFANPASSVKNMEKEDMRAFDLCHGVPIKNSIYMSYGTYHLPDDIKQLTKSGCSGLPLPLLFA